MSANNHESDPSYGFGDYAAGSGAAVCEPDCACHMPEDSDWERCKQALHRKLCDELQFDKLEALDDQQRRSEIRRAIQQLVDADERVLSASDRRRLEEELADEVLGLGPLEKLLRDPTVGDILVNGCRQTFVERNGRLEEIAVRFLNDNHLLAIIHRIVGAVGRRVDEKSPLVDARLPDGSRVNAVVPPLSLRGPTLSIRRFAKDAFDLDDLLRLKTLCPEIAELLQVAIQARLNIIIAGGTGSGKTTLLNALSSHIPGDERIITIEDAAELQLQQRHIVQLETRPANIEGEGRITIRDLVRNSLRMRPNRIIVGECRGDEAVDMLQAMNTGHDGSLTTLHANSPRDTLSRLEMMVAMAGLDIPLRTVREQIASAIDLIVQIDRLQGGPRRVVSVSEIVGMENDVVMMQELFVFRQQGVDRQGVAFGQFESCGIALHATPRIQEAGLSLPADLFAPRVLLKA